MISSYKGLTKEKLIVLLKEEIKNINFQITSQNNSKKKLVSCLRDYVFDINYSDIDTACMDISNLTIMLKECDDNINRYEILLSKILNVKINLVNGTLDSTISMIVEYNELYSKMIVVIEKVNEKVEKFYSTFSKSIVPLEQSNNNENTLLISEVLGKVVLPYTDDEIYSIMHKDKSFSSFQDVVDKLYTIPLSYYKNAFKARFKEAYKLVKEREKGTSKQAFDLAMELAFNRKLNPAIISACKTIDVLDIYLSCLEYNELSDFHFFKIKYEMNPIDEKVKKNKKVKEKIVKEKEPKEKDSKKSKESKEGNPVDSKEPIEKISEESKVPIKKENEDPKEKESEENKEIKKELTKENTKPKEKKINKKAQKEILEEENNSEEKIFEDIKDIQDQIKEVVNKKEKTAKRKSAKKNTKSKEEAIKKEDKKAKVKSTKQNKKLDEEAKKTA